MPLPIYSGTFGPDERRHLLRRTLFGVTKSDIDFFQNKNLSQMVTALLDSEPAPTAPNRWVDAYKNNGDTNTPPAQRLMQAVFSPIINMPAQREMSIRPG